MAPIFFNNNIGVKRRQLVLVVDWEARFTPKNTIFHGTDASTELFTIGINRQKTQTASYYGHKKRNANIGNESAFCRTKSN